MNPIFDSNEDIDNSVGVGNCAGTVSQQDESGSAAAPITSQTANPTIELQRTTTTQPPLTGTPPSVDGCVECFNVLSETQKTEVEESLSDGGFPGITTFEELCTFAINEILQGADPTTFTEQLQTILNDPDIGINSEVVNEIIRCFESNVV